MYDVIMKAFGQTVYMVIGSTLFSVILGFIPAIVLTVIALTACGLIRSFMGS